MVRNSIGEMEQKLSKFFLQSNNNGTVPMYTRNTSDTAKI